MSHGGWSELWHARLVTRKNDGDAFTEPSVAEPAPLRAIWSQDFDPQEKLSAAGMFDNDPDIGRTVMSALDRKQIVTLTSAFHGYVSVGENGAQSPFKPKPIECERLMLSPLGGWLKSHGQWEPPYAQRLRIGGDEIIEWQSVLRPELLAAREPIRARREVEPPVALVPVDDANPIRADALALHPFIPGLVQGAGRSAQSVRVGAYTARDHEACRTALEIPGTAREVLGLDSKLADAAFGIRDRVNIDSIVVSVDLDDVSELRSKKSLRLWANKSDARSRSRIGERSGPFIGARYEMSGHLASRVGTAKRGLSAQRAEPDRTG